MKKFPPGFRKASAILRTYMERTPRPNGDVQRYGTDRESLGALLGYREGIEGVRVQGFVYVSKINGVLRSVDEVEIERVGDAPIVVCDGPRAVRPREAAAWNESGGADGVRFPVEALL